MAPMTRSFVASIERFARDAGIDIVRFSRGERKDEHTRERLRHWDDREGVLYIGKAQERARVLRTERRQRPESGSSYPWLVESTAMANQYYVYVFDNDFGPLFVKFNSYFPYNAKLCLNGHEYLKRQLAKRGIGFEALDNGILRCDDPDAMQAIAREITAPRIDALFRKWLARLPYPFTARDRAAGIRYDLSVPQAEFALTQVLDRPLHGRMFFEEVLRENLDLGRPDHVQVIFSRRINRRTPSQYRTRVITDGVIPSLPVDYKRSRIKQLLQGRPCLAHGNRHQQHLRLRHRQKARQPRRSPEDRLRRQPALTPRPNPEPRHPARLRSPSNNCTGPRSSSSAAYPPCASATSASTPSWPAC